jgi:hypothetical protein
MLFSRETRRKLSALRRRPRSATPAAEPAPYEPDPRVTSDAASGLDEVSEPAVSRPSLPGAPVPVDALFPGEVVENDLGLCYVMRPDAVVASRADSLARGLTSLARAPVDRPAGSNAGPLDLGFIDIETLGLSALPVFLVGILRYREGSFSLTQVLARDFPEEAPLLQETLAALSDCALLFSYNGAVFDLPYLEQRAIYHAVDWDFDAEHIDLLKPARQRFRRQFPDCRLQTLETLLCGRERDDDIPGAEIPRRYQEFVRSQDARLLAQIIRHNQLDLLTLAEIVPHCLGHDAP